VPWCAQCNRFLSPSTVRTDGACPRCGATVDPGQARSAGDTSKRTVPWHLKALIGVFVIYLGYRVGQGIEWLVQQL